jgi:hypothetical protein
LGGLRQAFVTGYLAIFKGGMMGELEPAVVKPQSRQQRNDLEILSKMQMLRDDPKSRSFRFSHGYFLFRSKIFTVIFQGLLVALFMVVYLLVFDAFRSGKHTVWVHILQFRIPATSVWYVTTISSLFVLDTTCLLTGVLGKARRLMFTSIFIILLIAPSVFFHWDR